MKNILLTNFTKMNRSYFLFFINIDHIVLAVQT